MHNNVEQKKERNNNNKKTIHNKTIIQRGSYSKCDKLFKTNASLGLGAVELKGLLTIWKIFKDFS